MQYYVSQASRISLQIAFTLTLLITSSCGEEQITNSQQPNADQDPKALLALTGSIQINSSGSGCTPATQGNTSQVGWTQVGTVNGPFTISATGEASWKGAGSRANPDGIINDSGNYNGYSILLPPTLHMALIGRIDQGAPFPVGSNFNSSQRGITATGVLELRVNDTCQTDNAGSYSVTTTGVSTSPTTPPPTSPSPSPSCSITVANSNPALVGGKIPQRGATLTFDIRPSNGARVASEPYPFVEFNYNAGSTFRYFGATVVNSENRPGNCGVQVEQLGGTEPILNVTRTAQGVVRSTNGGIACGNQESSCSQAFSSPTRVELQATPIPGYEVSGWNGCTTSSSNTCVVLVSSPQLVSPYYRPTCSLSIEGGLLANGKIPQERANLSFAVTSPSGATATALSVSPSSARVSPSLNPLRMTVNANSGTSERPLAFQATVRDSRGQTGSCTITVQQAAPPMQCPVVSVPTCSAPGGSAGSSGGCTSVSEGQEAVVAVQVQALSSRLQNFVNTMRGTESILDSAFERVIGELPGVQRSNIREIIFSGQRDRRYFRSIEFGDLGNKVPILFERKRGPRGYYVWVPISWAPSIWRANLNIDQKNDELVDQVMTSTFVRQRETFLTVLESLAFAFPGVYGTNELINGGSGGARVLGATSLVADVASFGIARGLTIMGRTVASASSCRAVVLTGAAARVTNAAVNPSLGTGIDAALASVEVGSMVGVQFVRVIIRNGKGFIKSSSPRSGAQAIASSLGKRLDEIVEGGQGIPLDQLGQLGIRSGSGAPMPPLGALLGRGGRAQVFESTTNPNQVIKVLHNQPANPQELIAERCRQFGTAENLGIPVLRETGVLTDTGSLYFVQNRAAAVNPHDPAFRAIYDAAREKIRCANGVFVDVDNPANWGFANGRYFLIDP